MDKIKVDKELFDALNKALKITGKENFLKTHAKNFKWVSESFQPLNHLSSLKLAEILIKGYEVEKTPEEKLLEIYKDSKENYPGEINFRNGISLALNVLNINIEGIND